MDVLDNVNAIINIKDALAATISKGEGSLWLPLVFQSMSLIFTGNRELVPVSSVPKREDGWRFGPVAPDYTGSKPGNRPVHEAVKMMEGIGNASLDHRLDSFSVCRFGSSGKIS